MISFWANSQNFGIFGSTTGDPVQVARMREVGYGEPMSERKSKQALERESVGTLAIDTGEGLPPYALPMAYGYNRTFPIVFQFVVHTESEKMRYLDGPTPATLTVTDRTRQGGWISVMAQGEVAPVPTDERDRAEAIFENHGPETEVDLFPERDDYHLELWLLSIGELHGRFSGSHEAPELR
jgi:hypothetical protein